MSTIAAAMADIPEVIFPGAQSESQLQRRFDSDPEKKAGGAGGPAARPKVPNIYVKKPHRKQPALGLFLAKADPADREDWRLTTGESWQCQQSPESFKKS